MGDFSIDTREFSEAITEVINKHKKDAPKYLNKKALAVVIGSKGHKGAIQETPEASSSKIKAVTNRQLAGRVIKRAKQKGDWPLTGPQIAEFVKKERKRMRASVAYTRGPGWFNAAKSLGGTGGRGKKARPQSGFQKSQAARGSGKKATESKVEAEITNTAPASEIIGYEGLQRAINNQVADMRSYGADELLGKTLSEHSASS